MNTAIGIMSFTGTLIIYSAFESSFKVPAELWGLATAASVYLFSTAKSERGGSKNQDERRDTNEEVEREQ